MAVIEVPDIGVKKGNNIYSLRDMKIKVGGSLQTFTDGCGVKKGNNIYVLEGGSLAGNDWVCQQKFVHDYVDGEVGSDIFKTFEGQFNDVKLHGDKILLSHNAGFVEYNTKTQQVTKEFRPTGVHATYTGTITNSPKFAWFTVDSSFNMDYFYYYYGGDSNRDVDKYRNYTFNKYDSSTNSCTILYDNDDKGGMDIKTNPATAHDTCEYMISIIAKEGNYILWSQNADSMWYFTSTTSGLNGIHNEATANFSMFKSSNEEILRFTGWADYVSGGRYMNASEHIIVFTNDSQYTYKLPNGTYKSIEERLTYFVTKNKAQFSIDRGNYDKYSYVINDARLKTPASIIVEREDPSPRFIVIDKSGYTGLVDSTGTLIKKLLTFPEPVNIGAYDRETRRLAGLTKTKCYYTTLNI